MVDPTSEKKFLPEQEVLTTPESSIGRSQETQKAAPDKAVEKAIETAPVSSLKTGTQPTANVPNPPQKSEVVIEVEKIMEEGLGEFYQSMPPEAQSKFRKKGEEVLLKLSIMVQDFKVQFKQALHLIRDWLLCIPGVNKFFLEQEAKIKVDQLIELVEARRQDRQNRP